MGVADCRAQPAEPAPFLGGDEGEVRPVDAFAFDIRGAVDAAAAGLTGAAAAVLAPQRPIDRGTVVETVLTQNLVIRDAVLASESAGHAVERQEAVFDPIVSASFAHSRFKTYERSEVIGRLRTADPDEAGDTADDDVNDDGTFSLGCVTVDGETVAVDSDACNQTPEFSRALEFASTDSPWNYDYTTSLGGGISFPFGGSVSATVSSTFREKFSFPLDALDRPLGDLEEDPFGYGSDSPWTSNAALTFEMPFPFAQDFGRTGNPSSFAVRLADSEAKQTAHLAEAARNDRLGVALLTYWDLIDNGGALAVLLEQRAILDERIERLRRLVEGGQIAEYDLVQAEATLAAIDGRVRIALEQYQIVSNQLLTLLADNRPATLVPVDAQALLEAELDRATDDAAVRASEENPLIAAAQENLRAGDLTQEFRELQLRPDLDFVVSASFTESDTVIGYDTWLDSMEGLSKPDTTNVFVGMRFTYPLGRRAEEGAAVQARVARRQAQDNLNQTRKEVSAAVERALISLRSNEAQARQTQTELDLASFSYERASALVEVGLVSEFELLNRYIDLTEARLSRIAAEVALKRSEIQLLVAKGTLAEDYSR